MRCSRCNIEFEYAWQHACFVEQQPQMIRSSVNGDMQVDAPKDYRRASPQRPAIGLLSCDADHCTPEERAVINTGLAFRQAENAHWVESEVGSDPARTYRERSRAYIEFTNACHALLAARAGKEER